MSEADFERLGVFYLGKKYDSLAGLSPQLCLYDSRDLTMHSLCLGGPDSGKTGLTVTLMEEAAIDSIPVIAIDTKGKLGNILLQFPELGHSDFLVWQDVEALRKSQLSETEFAKRQAEICEAGLRQFEQTPERIKLLADSAEFGIYTPGSNAGLSVSLAALLHSPPDTVLENSDGLRERITSNILALLSLIDVANAAEHNREQILLSHLIKNAWQNRQDLSPADLIKLIKQPNLTHIGALEVEEFYPCSERLLLVAKLNELIASLTFDALMTGQKLDISSTLHTTAGKPKVSIFSLSHLRPAERTLFVSHLLGELSAWMQNQSSTTSLRALLVIDEIDDFLPSGSPSPTKTHLQALIRHGGDYGVGLALCSERPERLDYDILANVGTWFIGALNQTEKSHALRGLENAASLAGANIDSETLKQSVGSLPARVFAMSILNDNSTAVFQTRWTLSYMRGNLSSGQIRTIMSAHKSPAPKPIPAQPARAAAAASAPIQTAANTNTEPWWAQADVPSKPAVTAAPTSLPAVQTSQIVTAPQSPGVAVTAPPSNSSIGLQFMPVRRAVPENAELIYEPVIFAVGNVRFVDEAIGLNTKLQYCLIVPPASPGQAVEWDRAQPAKVWMEDLLPSAQPGARLGTVPEFDAQGQTMAQFASWLSKCKSIRLFQCEATGEYSKPRESERDFRVRLTQSARERRDSAAEALKLKYLPVLAQLNEKLLQAQQVFERVDKGQTDHKKQAAISLGTSVLGDYMGRKAAKWATDHSLDVSGIAHKTGAAKPLKRSAADEQNIQRATETVEALSEQIDDLNLEFGAAMLELEQKFDPLQTTLKEITVGTNKSNITVPFLGLVWAPIICTPDGEKQPAWLREA